MNKYLKSILVFFTLTAFFVPAFVLAENQSVSIPNPFGEDSTIWDIIGRILNWLFYIAAVAAIFVIIYAAYLFLFSAGDPEKVKTARRVIIYALIGVIVVFLSKGIINTLLSVIGSKALIK